MRKGEGGTEVTRGVERSGVSICLLFFLWSTCGTRSDGMECDGSRSEGLGLTECRKRGEKINSVQRGGEGINARTMDTSGKSFVQAGSGWERIISHNGHEMVME